MKTVDPRIAGIRVLLFAALRPPPGLGRKLFAISVGAVCHIIFALAVLSMMSAMFFGMSRGLGTVPWPWALLSNALLLAQFPLAHSWLLTGSGGRLLTRLVPGEHGKTLATTTFAIIASLQLLVLFALWTPTGIIWWRADGLSFWIICTAYAGSWLLLIKASLDAGVEVQSGALGWLSLFARIRPAYPGMPTRGLFRVIRHPIYVAFALTLWTVPVWTPDQLFLAITYTAYCLGAPMLKEKRLAARHGRRFRRYRRLVPYVIPQFRTGND